MRSIQNKHHKLEYDPSTHHVQFSGELDLGTAEEYEPLLLLLKEAVDASTDEKLIINLRPLKFINSSAINMLGKFAYYAREQKATVCLQGYSSVRWQRKLLGNLKRAVSSIETELSKPESQ